MKQFKTTTASVNPGAEEPVNNPILGRHRPGDCRVKAERCAEGSAGQKAETTGMIEQLDWKGVVADHDPLFKASLTELVDHIEASHHAYLRSELPRLSTLIEIVVRSHGDRHPELYEIASIFSQFQAEMEIHMGDEETVVFPLCRELEHRHPGLRRHSGTIFALIESLEEDHASQTDDMAHLKMLTNDFTPPTDACAAYCDVFGSLSRIAADTEQHVHKENDILFPRAAALEWSRLESHEGVHS